jgi:uncharacterized membrane protein YeaQ/YmgE (transglycosylase-associated protein family)
MLVALILVILASGLIGALARLAVPGPDPMAWWQTVLLGWAGSLLGGIVAWVFLGHAGGIVFAIVGAIALLLLYRRFVQRRPLTGPGARRLP